ncbi:hypothetical protein CRG98_024223 [Punica granatum]|uniref:Uncharacterized protein n=1 Tax=Punica granatum TaxID=22663 RepID=A0A2I0JGI9_PUNGR|nr:hypothetical protein CRG98_024223 [Punica granatum]
MSVGMLWFVRWVLIMATFVNGWAVLQWPTNRRGLGFLATFVYDRFDIACGVNPRLMQSYKNAAQREKSNSSTSDLHQVDKRPTWYRALEIHRLFCAGVHVGPGFRGGGAVVTYLARSCEVQEGLMALPVEIRVMYNMLFIVFLTTHHGFGFPVFAV